MAPTSVPYRKTFAFPKTDESTAAWWEAQADPSLSVKLLIRSEIERHGYTDTANRPVRQLPRRGRPPKDDELDFDDEQSQSVAQDEDSQTHADSADAADQPALRREVTATAKATKNTADAAEADGMDDILGQLGNN